MPVGAIKKAPPGAGKSPASGNLLAAALLVLGQGEEPEILESDEPIRKAPKVKGAARERKRPEKKAPEKKAAPARKNAPKQQPSAAASSTATAEGDDEEALSDLPPAPSVKHYWRGGLPSIAAMRKAGYLGDERELKTVWAWVRDQGDGAVWPTPTAGVQEAVRFDSCGWPSDNSTPEEWVTYLTFWTALREQLVGGASRAQRRAAACRPTQRASRRSRRCRSAS